jgi:voltage-gated potassium channel
LATDSSPQQLKSAQPLKEASFARLPGWKRFFHWLTDIFEMPPPQLATLPERLILLVGIRSWVVAGLLDGVIFYLSFIALAYADGLLALLTDSGRLWQTLLVPVIGAYLLLVQPLLRLRLTHTLEAYRKIVPFNSRLKRMEEHAYTLRRSGEIISLVIGSVAGYFLLSTPLANNYPSAILYELYTDVAIFGMLAWLIYAALFRTRQLSLIHDHVQNLTVFQTSVPYRQIAIWSALNAAVFLAGIGVSAIFLRGGDFQQRTAIIVYTTLLLAAILVFVFSRVPASIINQFRVFRAFFLFIIVAVVGTIGYNRLENWEPADALYATVITMTTIGYGDYSPITAEGRIFTVFLSLFAIGIGGYAVTSFASFVIEGNFSRLLKNQQVDKRITNMSDHYVVCGAGNLGRQIAIEFYKSQVPFVVIEHSSEVLENLLHEVEIPFVQADATEDETLRLAGVERAAGLVAALSDDKDNIFVTLSARSLNNQMEIAARLTSDKNRQKLFKAGADRVISPNAVSGRRMASEMLHSEVVTLLDEMLRAEQQTGQTLRLEEVHINQIKIPALVEKLSNNDLHINDVGQRTELMVVAIRRGTIGPNDKDPYIYTPRGNTLLQRDDVLIVMGTPEQRLKLQHDVLSRTSRFSWLREVLD